MALWLRALLSLLALGLAVSTRAPSTRAPSTRAPSRTPTSARPSRVPAVASSRRPSAQPTTRAPSVAPSASSLAPTTQQPPTEQPPALRAAAPTSRPSNSSMDRILDSAPRGRVRFLDSDTRWVLLLGVLMVPALCLGGLCLRTCSAPDRSSKLVELQRQGEIDSAREYVPKSGDRVDWNLPGNRTLENRLRVSGLLDSAYVPHYSDVAALGVIGSLDLPPEREPTPPWSATLRDPFGKRSHLAASRAPNRSLFGMDDRSGSLPPRARRGDLSAKEAEQLRRRKEDRARRSALAAEQKSIPRQGRASLESLRIQHMCTDDLPVVGVGAVEGLEEEVDEEEEEEEDEEEGGAGSGRWSDLSDLTY